VCINVSLYEDTYIYKYNQEKKRKRRVASMKREIYGVELDNNHSIDAQNKGGKGEEDWNLLGIAMIAETLLGKSVIFGIAMMKHLILHHICVCT
jgi:hypothetical protein